MLTIILFFLGFLVLIKGAEVLIDGASVLAKRLGVSDLIIGLTIVAFGTSLPELIISLFANSHKIADLAISNVIGSNISNTLLVLGVAAIIHPLAVHRVTVWREILYVVFASIMFGVLVADKFIGTGGFTGLDHIDGLVLMSYFAIFLHYSFGSSRTSRKRAEEAFQESESISVAGVFLRIVGGVIGLYLGGEWIVNGAVYFAEAAGMSEALIGLSIVAIGTSLPELAAAVVAARKRNVDIAIGSIVGSNLFNIMWVLGLNATLSPLLFADFLISDVIVMAMTSILLFTVMIIGGKHVLKRAHGFAFISIYVVYLALTVIRG